MRGYISAALNPLVCGNLLQSIHFIFSIYFMLISYLTLLLAYMFIIFLNISIILTYPYILSFFTFNSAVLLHAINYHLLS